MADATDLKSVGIYLVGVRVPPWALISKRTFMVYLYVIQSGVNNKRYVGITNNLNRRLLEHKNKTTKGGQILKGDFILLHSETFEDYVHARNREKFLKSGKGRAWLKMNKPIEFGSA